MPLKNNAIVILIVLLTSAFYVDFPAANAQEPTLAEEINRVSSSIHLTDSSWSVVYDQIFSRQNASIFDSAITKALDTGDYCSVIFIARLAELNDYSSQTINNSLIVALQRIPKCGSLPLTYYATNNAPDSYLLYDRYMINAYRYARELKVPGWDINQAFTDVANIYYSILQSNISNSQYGEMLFVSPQSNELVSYNSRYYDEHAETLGLFLEFALNGAANNITINNTELNATSLADDAWLCTQSHWSNARNIYGYGGNNTITECEMGNFAEIIAEYQNYRGALPYFDRVITDIENKLLVNGFNSSGWGPVGVIRHQDDNPQLRLQETLSAAIALQTLYPYFKPNQQSNFQKMQLQTWYGLVNSSLYDSDTSRFRFFDEGDGYDVSTNYDASFVGAMTLFLDGIVPGTGYLAFNASEERFNDYRTCFPIAQWHFDYANRTVRIPVIAGNLSFVFGSQRVTQNFSSNGVFDIYFADDWNSINSVDKVSNISNAPLQPATLKVIPRAYVNPPATPPSVARFYNSVTAEKTITKSTSKNQPTPTTSPTQTPPEQSTPTMIPPTMAQKNDLALILSAALGVSVLSGFAMFSFVKRKKHSLIEAQRNA